MLKKGGLFYLYKNFLDILFPIQCLGCQVYDCFLCERCLAQVIYNDSFFCPVCSVRLTWLGTCGQCKNKTALDALFIFCPYQDNVAIAIKEFKYRQYQEISRAFRDIIKQGLSNLGEKLYAFIKANPGISFVPVPLHPKRLADRGFNQAEELAKILQEFISVKLQTKIISRVKNTNYQSLLTKTKRQENVRNAFVITKKKLLPETVILIDDVYSTGFTMQESAKTLKAAGVKYVLGMALASGK